MFCFSFHFRISKLGHNLVVSDSSDTFSQKRLSARFKERCGKEFPTNKARLNHQKSMHSGPVVCKACGKPLPNQVALYNHLHRHRKAGRETFDVNHDYKQSRSPLQTYIL